MTTYYMGITAFHHSSSVALLDSNSNIINAAKEESFTGVRGDNTWPINSLKWAINNAKDQGYIIKKNNIIYGYYENPWIKFKRQLFETPSHVIRLLSEAQKPKKYIKNLKYGNHHKSHALSAIKMSPFNEGYYIIADGVGEEKSMSWGEFNNNRIVEAGHINYPNSLGILYAAFMNMLSLIPNRDEWKLDQFRQIGHVTQKIKEFIYDNIILLTNDSFEFKINLNTQTAFSSLFNNNTISVSEIPNWIRTLDDIVIEIITHIRNKHFKDTTKPLIFSGGIANDIYINSNLKTELWSGEVWVSPYPGNGGSAIGAALACISNHNLINYHTVFQGPSMDDSIKVTNTLLKNITKRLGNGQVIIWMQGPEEYSQNGLGHRFLLADPRNKNACGRMCNLTGKSYIHIDTVAVLSELINNYFHKIKSYEIYYRTGMMLGHIKNPEDFSGIINHNVRVLSIPQSMDCFRLLMIAWSTYSNCDILACNNLIQYNTRNDIIIKTQSQAIEFLMKTDVDCLVIGNKVYYKVEQLSSDGHKSIIIKYDNYTTRFF